MTSLTELHQSHTKGPWAVNPVTAQVDAFDTGKPVAVCQMLWPTLERTEAETEANAEFIVRAVNAHDDLLAALRETVSTLEEWASQNRAAKDQRRADGCENEASRIRAAIAKAQAEAV